MTTPALDEHIKIYTSCTMHVNDGAAPHTFLMAQSRRDRVRPASTTNHRRSDNTRPPGNWDAEYGIYRWFRGSGVLKSPWGPLYDRTLTGVVGTGMNTGSWFPRLEDGESLLQNARLSALASMTDSTKQLNAALAQANQTARMVGKAGRDIGNSLDGLMRGPKGLFRSVGGFSKWKNIPDRYLEWLYGWRPLQDDISNAFDKLNSYKDKGFGYSVLIEKKIKRVETVQHPMAWLYGPGQVVTTPISGSRKTNVVVKYRFDLPDYFINETPVIAPFSTLHELTPYSFVVDWFLPIGNWVGAMESAQFSPFFKEGSETLSMRDVYRSGSCNQPPISGWMYSASGSGEINTIKMRRRKIESYPWGALAPPALNPFPGLQQAAQGLSLLSQAAKRWR